MDDHRVKRRKHSHERSRSPGRRHRDSGREGARRSLPFDAPELKKDDLDAYRDIFAKYLHDKKDITIETLSSNEAYARFKSFIHKWNDGELSSRYYDPEYRRKLSHDNTTRKSPDASHENPRMEKTIGPTLPTQHDIQLQKEQRLEDSEAAREQHRLARKSARRAEKARLEELVPRADPGRDRQQEKRAETRAMHASFREKSPEAALGDRDLFADDVRGELERARRREKEREREREARGRMRDLEREERILALRGREDGTMDMLRKMAEERFGKAT